ncbi:Pumilio RNA-binding repeat [Macleaya cordata]|uniref:Pumilio RNA-binding repeat n=1 Tax=Macleaya cordata TaxID=56857 RepID=A0A200R7N6_MACCD|nr:Pumilio RNA-binding repeat [Macleaya cordata]
MAAKDQNSKGWNKRKNIGGAEKDGEKSITKRPKFDKLKPTKSSTSGLKKPFKSSKPNPVKFQSEKSDYVGDKKEPKTKREGRLQAKELAEARKKKRKRHYTLEQELASLWEKMRRRNIAKQDRSALVSEALQKMKGTIHEIAGSHVSSRVLQTCVKYCTQAERDAVFEELQPHLLTLASNTYAVHLVKKLLDNASKKQLESFISSLHGHVASLLRHMVGSVVVEHAFQLANASQRQSLLLELYSTELQLFKDLVSMKEGRLVDLIPKLGLQKASVVRHMNSVIQPILEKGIVDHSIIHSALMEYFSIADKSSAADVIQQLSSPLLVRMIHTKDGSKVGILCIKHGSAKERKKIIKGMKGHIRKTALDHYGSMVLVYILSTVDDTKLINKIIIRELQTSLKELVLDKNGRRPLLQLLHPNCHRYFGPEDLASLSSSVPSLCQKDEGSEVNSELGSGKGTGNDMETAGADTDNSKSTGESEQLVDGGKKDPSVRRVELLVNSGLAENLIDTCIDSTGELLRSNFGKEVIYEVATGGAGQVLQPTLADKLETLHKAIASLAALPKEEESEKKHGVAALSPLESIVHFSKQEKKKHALLIKKEEEKKHVLENFHSSRTIRKLILDCPTFASTLWKVALEGKCEMWAQGHSSKVVCAFLESSDSEVQDLAKPELQPLIDSGVLKMPESKLSKQ